MDSTNEGHAPMKKGSQLAPFALPLTAYFFVGWFKSDSSREALQKATREERGLGDASFFCERAGQAAGAQFSAMLSLRR